MAPINLPDGTEVSEIVLPDGSTASEVLAPDGSTVFGNAIPDKSLLHELHDARQLGLSDGSSVSTWADESGNGFDLSAGGAPTFKTGVINSEPIVRFDGVDDYLDNSYTQLTDPVVWGFVFIDQDPTTTDIAGFLDANTTNGAQFQAGRSDYGIFAGDKLVEGGTATSNPRICTIRWDGSNTVVRLDGTQVISGNPGSSAIDGITMGAQGNQVAFHPIDMGLFGVWDGNASLTDIEAYLDNEYGPIL